MILEKQTESLIHQQGETQGSIGMSLDLDSAQVLMQMLSKNLYSDAIGSTIRECASNALDSHRRAGVTKPIIVSFKANERDNYEFSVEDFGIGLDASDVENIISKYGKSTKRNSSTELGMMGLGFKAPLAYSSSFYFVCRKDGVERKYMMYEGEDTNTIDLLYEQATTEENGVKVIVPVKYYDRVEFREKIKEQLAYFQNVYFDCEGHVNNNFFIYRTDLFQFSELASDKYLHLCLDDVYYPIDFQKLGIDKIHFPVAIRLGLTDGVFPTPNRESIRYTKEAKEIIVNKIRQIANYLVEKYNEDVKETDSIGDIMEYYSSQNRYLTIGALKKDISVFEKYATISMIEPKLKGIEVLNLKTLHRNKDYILKEYQVKYMINGGKWREIKQYYHRDLDVRKIATASPKKYFIYSDKISGRMKNYLKETYGSNTGYTNEVRIVKKTKSFGLGKLNTVDYDNYTSILSLNTIPKDKWRTAIQEFQYIIGLFINSFIDIDKIEIPQDWIDSKKKVKIQASGGTYTPGQRKVRLQGDIVGKEGTALERYVDGKNCKWVSTTYKLQNMHQEKALMVYGGANDVEIMDQLFKIVNFHRCKTTLRFVQFSDRELKNMESINIHNWMKLETFMKGDNAPFRRIVTAYLIYKLIDNHKSVFNKRNKLETVSSDLVDKLSLLEEYSDNHIYGSEKIYDAMLEVAEANNLFDHSIYYIYKDVRNLLERLTFLEPLCDAMPLYKNEDTEKIVKAIADLFKYYKQRIDWKNYNIKLTEEVLLEQPLTEETMDELVEN